MYVCICIYVYMYVCIYTYICICICIYIYTHIDITNYISFLALCFLLFLRCLVYTAKSTKFDALVFEGYILWTLGSRKSTGSWGTTISVMGDYFFSSDSNSNSNLSSDGKETLCQTPIIKKPCVRPQS